MSQAADKDKAAADKKKADAPPSTTDKKADAPPSTTDKEQTNAPPYKKPETTGRRGSGRPGARMLFPTSGRVGFEPVVYNGPAIPKDVLVKMLRIENEIRLTEEVQDKLDQTIIADSDSYTEIIEGIQKTVLKQFGFEADQTNLTRYRAASSMYPDDAEIKNEAYYYKFNRSRQGNLKEGDSINLQSLSLYNLATNQHQNIYDILQVESNTQLPLVLIAGSISWPPMLGFTPSFEQMMETFKGKARFLIVYITEAHSADEWPVGKTISFCDQPKTLNQRIDLAKTYQQKFNSQISIAVDPMTNDFDQMFSAWPIRMFIVQEGKLVYKAQPNTEFYGYDIQELENWLNLNA